MEQEGRDRQNGKAREERYAYYRRCQKIMRNGEQCRCPAEKGERVCRNHRQRVESIVREQQQRFRVLARVADARGLQSPMEVFTDPRSAQMALAMVGQEVAEDTMDLKVASRLLTELQRACALFSRR
jgi:hypothetical protein